MESRAKVWLTGAGGQLGTAIRRLFPNPDGFDRIATCRGEVELTDLDEVREFVRRHKFDVIVNAAAFTAVDRAEVDVELARMVNVELPRVLSEELAGHGGTLVHVSTDYVFGGDETRRVPYTEEDDTAPLGVYGQTKADGEETLLMLSERCVILRTAWLYGPAEWGKSFYRAIRERVLGGEPLRVVTDEVGSPTSTMTLARVIHAVVEDVVSGRGRVPLGLYHVADEGETSRHHFAEVIGAMISGHEYEVTPITHADLASPARRPEYSALSSARMKALLPDYFRPWQEALAEVVRHDEGEE